MSEFEGVSDREMLEFVLTELKEVRREVEELRRNHTETVAQVHNLLENLAPHLEQVGPMIDALANNPMFKMLAGGKKK